LEKTADHVGMRLLHKTNVGVVWQDAGGDFGLRFVPLVRPDVDASILLTDQANNNSGLIGAVIVGTFVFVVFVWYIAPFVWRRIRGRRAPMHI
jgi:hypothetical protein